MLGASAYGTSGVSPTFGTAINSLTNGSLTLSNAISASNTSPQVNNADCLVGGTFVTGASGVSATGTITILVAASVDASTYASNVADCKVLAVLTANSNSLTLKLDPTSIAALYGGHLPANFKIGVLNNSGATLASSGNSMIYQMLQDDAR